jgi:transcription elongation factor SPT6
MVKEELRYPYLDMRPFMREPSKEKLFDLITGESDIHLHVGLKVTATVETVTDRQAYCTIEGGMRATIWANDCSDQQFSHIAEVLTSNTTVSAVIIKVEKDSQRVALSTKKSLLDPAEHWWVINKDSQENMIEWCKLTNRLKFDSHFNLNKAVKELEDLHQDEEEKAEQMIATLKEQQECSSAALSTGLGKKHTFVSRQCYHPAFKNINFKQAETLLAEMDVGEAYIRPSNQGGDRLSIAWSFQHGSYRHIDIEEKGKPEGDLGIAPELYVKDVDEPFSDLDDLLANYIAPMNELVEEMREFDKYREGDKDELEAYLKAEVAAAAGSVKYGFCKDHQHPGYFVLMWCNDKNKPAKYEYIAVHPKGYKWRGKMHDKPRHLVSGLKKLFAEKQRAARDVHNDNNNSSSSSSSSRLPSSSTGGARKPSRFSSIEQSGSSSSGGGGSSGAAPVRKSRFQDIAA